MVFIIPSYPPSFAIRAVPISIVLASILIAAGPFSTALADVTKPAAFKANRQVQTFLHTYGHHP